MHFEELNLLMHIICFTHTNLQTKIFSFRPTGGYVAVVYIAPRHAAKFNRNIQYIVYNTVRPGGT